MAIPDFQSLMLPLMELAADGQEHTARETRQAIADELGLSEEERKELVPSGAQPIFTNRLAWARSHLQRAGLLEKTGRGTFRIAERGRTVFADNPPALSIKYLRR